MGYLPHFVGLGVGLRPIRHGGGLLLCCGWNGCSLGDPETFLYPLYILGLIYFKRAGASIARYVIPQVVGWFPQVLDRETGVEVLQRLLLVTLCCA